MLDDAKLRLHVIAKARDKTLASWNKAKGEFTPGQREFLMNFGTWVIELARMLRKEEGDIVVFE